MGLLYSYKFQSPKSEIYFFSAFFHDFVVVGLFFMMLFVGVMFFFSMKETLVLKSKNSLEVYLMVFPVLFLLMLSVPSMMLLQSKGGDYLETEDVYVDSSQWYWEYTMGKIPCFISRLCETCLDSWHKLEPNIPLVLNVGNQKFFFFSKDVLHCFAVPSMGVKVDCIPGMLVSLETNILSSGMFYGQCSELCGMNHSFMPIEVEVGKMKKNATM